MMGIFIKVDIVKLERWYTKWQLLSKLISIGLTSLFCAKRSVIGIKFRITSSIIPFVKLFFVILFYLLLSL